MNIPDFVQFQVSRIKEEVTKARLNGNKECEVVIHVMDSDAYPEAIAGNLQEELEKEFDKDGFRFEITVETGVLAVVVKNLQKESKKSFFMKKNKIKIIR